ncbi:flavodoxin [Mesorhizobium kowhaii]|uniref:Flavodoxin n=1 Tax=Mesorhizobium kowhaii TaxID=1300272 RepID=A0A2W7C994_9HYPH|nr:flavodoxin [Mesorhizobium kowhaii]PZV39497.1 flavodoxin [Mesorhizobium kowhaii]
MSKPSLFSRRGALMTALALPLGTGLSLPASASKARPAGGAKILVAYYTRTGNTRVIARQIGRARGADIFEIQTANPYPEDYAEQVAVAQQQRDSGFEPPLAATVPGVKSYETVFLGFPIWGMTAPSVIRSFLSRHDLSGKTLVPFITHGGYGLGESLKVLADHAPGARLIEGFSKQCDQERETLEQVTGWLGRVDVPG